MEINISISMLIFFPLYSSRPPHKKDGVTFTIRDYIFLFFSFLKEEIYLDISKNITKGKEDKKSSKKKKKKKQLYIFIKDAPLKGHVLYIFLYFFLLFVSVVNPR